MRSPSLARILPWRCGFFVVREIGSAGLRLGPTFCRAGGAPDGPKARHPRVVGSCSAPRSPFGLAPIRIRKSPLETRNPMYALIIHIQVVKHSKGE